MRAILKPGVVVLLPEDDAERATFDAWRLSLDGHVFVCRGGSPDSAVLHDLGPRAEACREPINILFDNADAWQPISNLAETPFVLRGMAYASVEGFWQGLKFEAEAERRRVAALSGKAAKRAGNGVPVSEKIVFGGEAFATGGPVHHALMLEACRAKFAQHLLAREALLATGDRPLTHRVRRDSRTIPGALMADIWMRIRAGLRAGAEPV